MTRPSHAPTLEKDRMRFRSRPRPDPRFDRARWSPRSPTVATSTTTACAAGALAARSGHARHLARRLHGRAVRPVDRRARRGHPHGRRRDRRPGAVPARHGLGEAGRDPGAHRGRPRRRRGRRRSSSRRTTRAPPRRRSTSGTRRSHASSRTCRSSPTTCPSRTAVEIAPRDGRAAVPRPREDHDLGARFELGREAGAGVVRDVDRRQSGVVSWNAALAAAFRSPCRDSTSNPI